MSEKWACLQWLGFNGLALISAHCRDCARSTQNFLHDPNYYPHKHRETLNKNSKFKLMTIHITLIKYNHRGPGDAPQLWTTEDFAFTFTK